VTTPGSPAFMQGATSQLLASIREALASIESNRARMQAAAPCGLTSGDLHELLGYALGTLEGTRSTLERMTETETPKSNPNS
jgi:hypothetical protein